MEEGEEVPSGGRSKGGRCVDSAKRRLAPLFYPINDGIKRVQDAKAASLGFPPVGPSRARQRSLHTTPALSTHRSIQQTPWAHDDFLTWNQLAGSSMDATRGELTSQRP